MHAVRNQPQGFIEMPEDQTTSSRHRISDQDRTLEMTLQRLAAGDAEESVLELARSTGRLLSEPESSANALVDIVFTDSVQLELDLAAEMNSLMERMQKGNPSTESRYL